MEKKQYNIKEVDDDDRIIRILASDESVDRDGDIIKASGWDFTDFLKSGSIIYGHNPGNLPLARPVSAEIVGKKFYVSAQFAEEGTSEFNDAIYKLIKQKIVRGVSVGFKANEWTDTESGHIFEKQQLLELSVTPIPANPNAMLQVKEYGDEIVKSIFKEEGIEQEEMNIEPEEMKPEEVKVEDDPIGEKLEHIMQALSKL